MATLPAVPRNETPAQEGGPMPVARPQPDAFRLRPLPQEDVFFFCKTIDNSRLVRQANPQERGACWTAIGAAAVLLFAATGVLIPAVAGTLAGYRLEALRQEERKLTDERRVLELEEARLLNPARLEELAERQKLVTPAPGQVIHLDGKNDSSVAMNKQ